MKKFVPIESRNMIAGLLVVLSTILPGGAAVLRVPNQYPTIQGAVEAASSGDTIRIAAGVYEEQVLIVRKNLTLEGAPGAVLKAKPGLLATLAPLGDTEDLKVLLAVAFSDDVAVRGLTIDGARLGEANSPSFFGVLFHASSGRMEHCTVKGVRRETGLQESEKAFAAGNFANTGRPVQHVEVLDSLFEDNSYSIDLVGTGDPNTLRLTFVIRGNVIRGIGPSDTETQNGIFLRPGVSGEVKQNTITDHAFTGGFGFSIGIFGRGSLEDSTPLQPVFYEGNTFRNNQIHVVSLLGDNAQFVNNNFQASGGGYRAGGLYVSGDNLRIVNNDFSDVPTSITLFGDDPDFGTFLGTASNVKLIANRFCHVTTPLDIEPLVTGVTERGTKIGCERNDHEHDGDDDHDDHSLEDKHNH